MKRKYVYVCVVVDLTSAASETVNVVGLCFYTTWHVKTYCGHPSLIMAFLTFMSWQRGTQSLPLRTKFRTKLC